MTQTLPSPDLILSICNFQSIKEAEINLRGFVAIQGDSDLGKSAIVRALRSLLFNEWDPGYLRDGEKECQLSLEIPSPYPLSRVSLFKSEKRNEYILEFRDGRETKSYPKIGRDTPQELKDIGFTPIISERKDSFNLNIQPQLKPLFLVTNTGTELTSFFNTLFGIEKYERANRSINSAAMGLQRELNFVNNLLQEKTISHQTAETQVTRLSEEYAAKGDVVTRISALIWKVAKLDKLQQDMAALRERVAKHQGAIQRGRDTAIAMDILGLKITNAAKIAAATLNLDTLEQRQFEATTKQGQINTALSFIERMAPVVQRIYSQQIAWASVVELNQRKTANSLSIGKLATVAPFVDKVLDVLRKANALQKSTSRIVSLGHQHSTASNSVTMNSIAFSTLGLYQLKIGSISGSIQRLRNLSVICGSLQQLNVRRDNQANNKLFAETSAKAVDFAFDLLYQEAPPCSECGQFKSHKHA